MDTLFHRFQDSVKGVLEGFDRIVFKGMLRPLSFVGGMQSFLTNHSVLNKNFKEWAISQSGAIVSSTEALSRSQCNRGIEYIRSCHTRKEDLAHKQQEKDKITSGLIGAWSCVESCRTYKAVFDKANGFPALSRTESRCKHVYFYYDHPDLGFMSIRLQTWAPYEIQIALNGREWLRRLLDKQGVRYIMQGNKFLHIDNYEIGQQLMDTQLDTRWEDLLTGFLPEVFPTMSDLFNGEQAYTYTWTLWQSEWAKDYIFPDPTVLNSHMHHFMHYAFITGTYDRVLGYMGHPVRPDGQPYPTSNPELMSRVNLWYDGKRIRHWVDHNSIKMYNEQNVLRVELTMNDPTRFRIHRHVQGKPESEKKFLPMRKGIADIGVRAKVSGDRIRCFTEHMATVTEPVVFGDLIAGVSAPVFSDGKRFRALDITGKDLLFLQAVADPKYCVDAISNKLLQVALDKSPWAHGLHDKKLSSRISRHLRLLREHGLIKKLPKQNRYMLTDKGRKLTSALNQVMAVSIEELAKLAA